MYRTATIREVGEILGVSYHTAHKWISEAGIQRRNRGTMLNGKQKHARSLEHRKKLGQAVKRAWRNQRFKNRKYRPLSVQARQRVSDALRRRIETGLPVGGGLAPGKERRRTLWNRCSQCGMKSSRKERKDRDWAGFCSRKCHLQNQLGKRRKSPSKKILVALYCEQEKTTTEIAALFNTDASVIRRALKREGIDRRPARARPILVCRVTNCDGPVFKRRHTKSGVLYGTRCKKHRDTKLAK